MNRQMRAFVALASAAMLVATIVSAGAQGQGRGQGRRGGMFGGGGLMMLGIPAVQDELKMTEPQKSKLQEKQQGMREAMQEIMQNAGGPQAFQDPAQREKLMGQIQELQTKTVKDILDQKQYQRFHQLELQQAGAQALSRKDVADELKLTAEQKTKIGAAQQSGQQKSMQIFQNAGGGGGGGGGFPQLSEEDQKKLAEIRTQTAEAIQAILTDAQKKQWKEMQGEPFKFPAPPQRRAQPPQ